MDNVPFFMHDLGEAEIAGIRAVLTGPILTTGETVHRFEQLFAEYTGRHHALGVTSCTGALHLSLMALDIGHGDEVITTPMTFIATATAIIEAGATPVFVDVEDDTGNLDATKIEAAITQHTKAILPVHLYGQMCDMRAIRAIADRHKLAIVEDCAHCVEGSRDGVRPGQLSDTACFSFFATKSLSCGEGGAVVTNRDDMAKRLKLLSHHGMTKTSSDRHREGYQHWDMACMGWKYNMDNIQAAMLIPQMARLNEKIAKRHHLAQLYDEGLACLPEIELPRLRLGTVHARHLYPILVRPDFRDRVIQELDLAGIRVVVNYRAIHQLSFFRERLGYKAGSFPKAELFGSRTISLPFYPTMPEQHVSLVAEALARILDKLSGKVLTSRLSTTSAYSQWEKVNTK